MKKTCLLFVIVLTISTLNGQDLSNLISDSGQKKVHELVHGTFKDTRLTNFSTVEVLPRRTMQFVIEHRFGDLSSGAYNWFGLDGPASIRLGLDYSYNGRFMFGLGRSNDQKLFDGFVKYRLLRQTIDGHMPLSITLEAGADIISQHEYVFNFDPAVDSFINKYASFADRLVYKAQVIFARKFNDHLSLEIAPIWIHYNLVQDSGDMNDVFATTLLGRYKVTKRSSITLEYGVRLNKYEPGLHTGNDPFHNSFGIGWEIETGGHVFSIHLTNSYGIDEVQTIPYSTGNILKGNLKLGFNISRVFTL